jgi:hypothetical protein
LKKLLTIKYAETIFIAMSGGDIVIGSKEIESQG